MIYSMTGFGKCHFFFNGKKVNIEIKSLNSKQLDLIVKLPSVYKEKEFEVRNLVARELLRGKIDVYIFLEQDEVGKNYSINKELAKKYFDEIKAMENALKLKPMDEYVPIIIKLPDVIESPSTDIPAEEWDALLDNIKKCIDDANCFRMQEGKVLETDFRMRINNILENLNSILPFEEKRIEVIRKNIETQLNTLQQANYDKNRFEQEMIYYLEKIDITEEKVRLRNHCEYFLDTLSDDESKGKLLSFITQEIGREINTIGSKANDVNIQQLVIKMKDELEKIREQLANIL